MKRKIHPEKKLNNEKCSLCFTVITIFALLMTANMGSGLYAQVYPKQYLEEALENNPGLKVQQMAYEVAKQQVDIAGALPDPELSSGIYTPPMEELMGNRVFDAGVMQMFPWFGTLKKQEDAAGKLAESSHHKFRDERNRLFMEMTQLWLEIYKKDRQVEIISDFIKVLKDRERLIYIRYEGGRENSGLALDIYRLEIQLAELENRKEKLKEEKSALANIFNILSGRKNNAEIETPDSLPEIGIDAFDFYYDKNTFAENPKISMEQSKVEAAGIEKEVAKLKTRPMLGLGAQYSLFSPGNAAMGQMDGGHMIMPMISVSLPVYGRKNNALRQKGVILEEIAIMRKNNEINNLEMQWENLEANFKNLIRDKEFYKNQLNITMKAWELVLTGYAGGSENFDELLRIQDQLLQLKWKLLETNVSKHLKLAERDMIQAKNIFQ